MAQLMNLVQVNPADDVIAREVKCRVYWSLYMIDRWASAGLGLPRQINIGGLAPRLPMDELLFSQLNAGDSSEELVNWHPGIWSHMIALVKIFGYIQDLNKELVDQPDWDEDYIESRVLALAEQLTTFERELPPTMAFTKENLDLQVERGVGRAFVALHLGYHHYATLLYYQYLDQRRQANSTTIIFTQRCKYHAIAFSDLIYTSTQNGDTEA